MPDHKCFFAFLLDEGEPVGSVTSDDEDYLKLVKRRCPPGKNIEYFEISNKAFESVHRMNNLYDKNEFVQKDFIKMMTKLHDFWEEGLTQEELEEDFLTIEVTLNCLIDYRLPELFDKKMVLDKIINLKSDLGSTTDEFKKQLLKSILKELKFNLILAQQGKYVLKIDM